MFKKILLVISCLFLIFAVASCSNNGASYDKEYDGDSYQEGTSDTTGENDLIIQDTTRKITYTATLYIKSKKVKDDAKALNELVSKAGGYIETANSTSDDDGNVTRATYRYRIPTGQLTSFLSSVDEGFIVTSKDVGSKDITNAYNETEAEIEILNTKRALYVDMLEKATSYSEIMDIQNHIYEIDKQLSIYTKTKNSYDQLVNFSTVDVTITTKTVTSEPTFMDEYGTYVVGVFTVIFKFIMYLLPFVFIAGVVLTIIFVPKAIKKKKEQKKNQE